MMRIAVKQHIIARRGRQLAQHLDRVVKQSRLESIRHLHEPNRQLLRQSGRAIGQPLEPTDPDRRWFR